MYKNKTKIVATLGPTSNSEEMILAGTSMFRINTSHNTAEEHSKTIKKSEKLKRN